MATYFRMPGVSADSDEAVLESWSVEQGARVASGQTIASVETEKAVVDVESDVDAIVHTLLVAGRRHRAGRRPHRDPARRRRAGLGGREAARRPGGRGRPGRCGDGRRR